MQDNDVNDCPQRNSALVALKRHGLAWTLLPLVRGQQRGELVTLSTGLGEAPRKTSNVTLSTGLGEAPRKTSNVLHSLLVWERLQGKQAIWSRVNDKAKYRQQSAGFTCWSL
ncbi:hypothetical protein Bpfe_000347 [Biomphalaria pfeifferi]|uniref:Uncharacterized protein n=1 Tax=Biomphalaria pfeifferi TaxID=112525 RepID=A0AAD8CCM0_BIOPF|nr:hypothetical protein Bpfe_000347 [Biomphalaria pfeifferi]